MHSVQADNVLAGSSVSPGIAIGKAYRFEKTAFEATESKIEPDAVEDELSRFERAVGASEKDLRKIANVARSQLGTESAHLFDAQALILRDPSFQSQVQTLISDDLWAADYAVQSVMEQHRSRLEASQNPYLRERAHDMADVQVRLVRHLQQGRVLSRIREKRIVVAETLSAADLILFTRQKLLGCVLDHGSETSHVAIMARALGIPVVIGLAGRTREIGQSASLIVDGLTGHVVIDPTTEQLEDYEERKAAHERSLEASTALATIPAETVDGTRICLQANLEFEEELSHLTPYGAEGVGLFRTEMLFMSEPTIPGEDEQTAVYRRIVRAVAPLVTTFRLFDLGGDKASDLTSPSAPDERNPDLGWRGMRVLLDRPEILEGQLRALMRASADGPIRILLPMVTHLSELATVKEVRSRLEAKLEAEGIAHERSIPLGVMVEVPSVAIQADHFAREADFMSIGTNDLTQYTLAVERGNELVGHRYSSLEPAVLFLVRHTVEAGARHRKPTAICGELAGYGPAVPVLIGLGLRELSVSPFSLPDVKRIIRGVSLDEAEQLAKECQQSTEAEAVRALVRAWFDDRPGLLQTAGTDDSNE
jgi:phosphotransferase system enzyme I (PtsI)